MFIVAKLGSHLHSASTSSRTLPLLERTLYFACQRASKVSLKFCPTSAARSLSGDVGCYAPSMNRVL